ncbi:MAG TPA: response regulator [Burkholderiaceae bacterium]
MPRDKDTPPMWLMDADTQLERIAQLATRTVLVVDDNIPVATVTADVLRALGKDVNVVYNAKDALEAAIEDSPDVVILDIGLPGMDGYEVAARIRAHPRANPDMLIVALTGWGAEGHLARSCQAGFDKFWTKPVTMEQLQSL